MAAVKQEVISFNLDVPAATTVVLTERIKGSGTVESLFIKFYPGQEGDLHVYPYVNRMGNYDESMLTFPAGTNNFLAGDDDAISMDIKVPVVNDEEIKIVAVNVDPTYAYTLFVQVTIDYMGGENRMG